MKLLLIAALGLGVTAAIVTVACSSSSPDAAPVPDAGADASSVDGMAVGADGASEDAASQDAAPGPAAYSCSAGDAGVFDASALESTTIVSNAILPTALTVGGGSVFWVEIAVFNGPAAAIKSAPTVGGPVTTVYADTGAIGLPSALATDGTALYFVGGEYSSTVMKCDLTGPAACDADGSSPQTVASGDWGPAGSTSPNDLYLLDGALYLSVVTSSAQPDVLAISSDGGQALLPTAIPSAPTLALLGVSPFGVYYAQQEQVASFPALDLWAQPLDGGQASLLAQTQVTNVPGFFGVAVAGAALYMSNGGSISSQPAAAAGDGGGGTVLPIDGLDVVGMVADANGLYVASSGALCAAGIYAVSLTTGAVTLVQQDPTVSASTSLALDANNVYWTDGQGVVDNGAVTGNWEIHAKAR